MNQEGLRGGIIVLAIVFGAYAFTGLLPLSYRAMLALLNNVEYSRVARVVHKERGAFEEALNVQRKKLQDLRVALSNARGSHARVTAELLVREKDPNRAHPPCMTTPSGEMRRDDPCRQTSDLAGAQVEYEQVAKSSEQDIVIAERIVNEIEADLEAYDKLRDIKGDQDIRNLGLMLVAAAAGLLGAYLRLLISAPADYLADQQDKPGPAQKARTLRRNSALVVGPLLGIAVFWLLDSKFLIPLLYSGAVNLESIQQAQVTLPGVSISAAVAGLVGLELLGRMTERFVNALPADQNGKATANP